MHPLEIIDSDFPKIKKRFQSKEKSLSQNCSMAEESHNLLSVRLRVAVHYFDP